MNNSGIPYFPLECQLDEKFELIEAEFGLAGFAIVVKLFQRIYGGRGYYCEWTNEVALLFGKRCGLGGSAVSEIVSASIKRGIFDKDIYDKYGVLTSRRIQEQYFEAVSRRKIVSVKSEYLLLCNTLLPKNVDISAENVNNFAENADIFQQSKGEERKEEKRRVKESKSPSDKSEALTPENRNLLVSQFGKAVVAAYEQRFERWRVSKNVRNVDAFEVISRWLHEDRPKVDKNKSESSFDIEEVERLVNEKYGR